ncbi:MAG: CAP domain-containing protein [Ktedonobacterales bacterium]|nr:CAP domain-containing protein [Ktedonobacterales bacterium]
MRLRQILSYLVVCAVVGFVVVTLAHMHIPLARHGTLRGVPSPGSSATGPTPTVLPAVGTPTQVQDFANRVIARTNQYRAQFGCPALQLNTILMGTAEAHSEDMALHDFVGHNSSDGTTAWDRMARAGYHYAIVEENVAWGQQTPEQAVDAWFIETPPNDLHRKNILNCQVVDVGVGYYYLANDPGKITNHTYWTQDFGRPSP